MSSRPLFVKRTRLSYRRLLWASPILIFILAVTAWKVKRQDVLAWWTLPADSARAVLVTSSPPVQPTETSGKPDPNIQPESTPAPAIAALKTGVGQTTPVVQGSLPSTGGTTAALTTALDQWSTAWRAQDVPTYLGMYAADFLTPQGMSHRDWAQMRSARILGKQKIQHAIRDVQIDQQGLSATVKFTQIYADERTEITDGKTMQWVFREGRWLIKREATD